MDLIEKETICSLINEIKKEDLSHNQLQLLNKLKVRAEAMEDRLLAYCNSIEDLGFVREGRDYGNI